MLGELGLAAAAIVILFAIGFVIFILRCYRKIVPGTALIRNGLGGTRVSFDGIFVLPIIHKYQVMDTSVKRVEIQREGVDGLICKDNLRADIKVAFFVRVNKTAQDVLKVAEMIGTERASTRDALVELFDAKFSESLKTVGKQFDFVDLYNARREFKEQILELIGTDLNGYTLEDASIDYLEQTSLEYLKEGNILDSQGIKKITELTAAEKVKANQIRNEESKTITQQNVETREAILEMERQQAEAEEKNRREVANIKAREEAEAAKVREEERLKSEKARIATEEELSIAEENKSRQVIVACRNKERTDAIETERVEKDRQLEVTEREKIVALATIEKEKSLEVEKKNIQDTIRDRVMVEKTVIAEQEKIKDTQEFAEADRKKQVAITIAQAQAEEEQIIKVQKAEAEKASAALKAEEELFKRVKEAEAGRKAAEFQAEQVIIEADSFRAASEKKAEAKKMMAEAQAAEEAASGLAQAQVEEAKADAFQKRGDVEADILEKKAIAEAQGISQKAEAMKKLDAVGREHEEFKLKLEHERLIKESVLDTQKDVAMYQAEVLSKALSNAKIDIVGGETEFFDRIVGSISQAKAMDHLIYDSNVLTDVKDTFFKGNDPEHFKKQLRDLIDSLGMSIEELKDLKLSKLFSELSRKVSGDKKKDVQFMKGVAETGGMLGESVSSLLGLTEG